MTTYHLWRQYPTAPYYRWGAEVIQDDEAPEGYRVIKSDPIVADTAFFHRLSAAMSAGLDVLVMKTTSTIVAHERQRREPGSPDHFEHAIRNVEGAVLGQAPEKYKLGGTP